MMLSCIHWLFLLPLAGQIVVCHLFSSSSTEFAVLESSPVVGSSRKRTEGSIMSSMPMLVLFRSPPEIPRISWVPTWPQKKVYHFLSNNILFLSCFRLFLILTLESATRVSPSCSISLFTFCSLSWGEMLVGSRNAAEKVKFSRTVNVPITTSSCSPKTTNTKLLC